MWNTSNETHIVVIHIYTYIIYVAILAQAVSEFTLLHGSAPISRGQGVSLEDECVEYFPLLLLPIFAWVFSTCEENVRLLLGLVREKEGINTMVQLTLVWA